MNEDPATNPVAPTERSGNPDLIDAIRAEIAAEGGRITFARFMQMALYDPRHGYYLSPERRPGRGGDFLTAPEVHPFFGFALARQIADCWQRLGQPNPFVVREYGAGVGGLAYDIIAGLATEAPEVVAALRYRLIEPNPHRLAQALGAMREIGLAHRVTAETSPGPADDPEPIVGVALANEVADAFPVHRLVWAEGGFRERYVVWRGDRFADEDATLSTPELGADVLAAGVRLTEGDEVDVSPTAARWFAGVGRGLRRGYAIVLDYGYPAAELYRDHRLRGTVRAYAEHTVTDDPYRRVGGQDLTAHVDFTALQRAGESSGLALAGMTTQGAFLASLGLGDFLVQMQADPRMTLADYRTAQAAVLRLIDPGGMGRFGVLLMARGAPIAPPLRGLTVAPPDF